MSQDIAEHPDYMARLARMRLRRADQRRAAGGGRGRVHGPRRGHRGCALFQRGVAGTKGFAESFMTAASPGVIATIMHRPLDAFDRLARALHPGPRARDAQGVRADRRAGLRAPARLSGSRDGAHALFPGRVARRLPRRRGPAHRRDQRGHRGNPARPRASAPLLGQLRLGLTRTTCRSSRSCRSSTRAKVGALSLPLASPRHQHELKAFRQHPLPDEMLFLPGRHRLHDQRRRAPGSGRRPDHGGRGRRWATGRASWRAWTAASARSPARCSSKKAWSGPNSFALRQGADLATARLWGSSSAGAGGRGCATTRHACAAPGRLGPIWARLVRRSLGGAMVAATPTPGPGRRSTC